MSQSTVKRVIPKLRYKLHERRNLKNPEGPQGRHNKIRKTVTALFKYERIELNYHRADESRGYAERLISDAIRYGDCHQPTMEMATYWLLEEQLVHKLFKVLVPRYKNCGLSYTKLWRAANVYPGHGRPKCVIELRNNIFPPLGEDKSFNKNLIHNVLLDAARRAFNLNKKTSETSESKDTAVNSNDLEASGTQSDAEEKTSDCISAVDSNSESEKLSATDEQSKENIDTDNVNRGTDIENGSQGTVPGLEKDLSKLEITEEKPQGSPSEGEKK